MGERRSTIYAAEHGRCRTILETAEGIAWRKLHYGHAKLQSTAGSSIILAAFGMDVMASYAFTYPSHVPSWLMTLLSVNTVLMISMHCFAFMIGTCLIPYMHATSKEYHSPDECVNGHLEMVPNFSPHQRFPGFIRISHQISHVVGLFVFLLEIVLIAWVKFWDVSLKACVASTAIMLPFMVAFVAFWWYFNFSYKTQIYKHRTKVIQNVETMYKEAHQNLAFEVCSRRHSESIPRRRKSVGSQSTMSVHF